MSAAGNAAIAGARERQPQRRVLVPHGVAPLAPWPHARVHALAGRTMGTRWSVQLVNPTKASLPAIESNIQRELDMLDTQMSTWRRDSDLMRFNTAGAGSWHALPPPFFEVLAHAWAVARDSDGAFDPCAGALVEAWGFGAIRRFDEPAFVPPDETNVAAALARSGWRRLQLDPAGRRARQPGGLALDLSAVAKGYAVDRVSALLEREFGIAHALVEIGGELRGQGMKPDGQPWWVAVESPRANDPTPPTWVALHGLSIATSGDYRRFFMQGSTRHAHTIDPRLSRPIQNGVVSVSVMHPSCMAADAWSTALTVLGPGQGLAWAGQRQIAARFVVERSDGALQEHTTPAFDELAAD